MRLRALAFLALAGALAAAPLAAQQAAPQPDRARNTARTRTPAPPPPPRYVNPQTRANFARYCGAGAVPVPVPNRAEPVRVGFLAEPGAPVTLFECIDGFEVAVPIAIRDIGTALVFMAYKPFAPFWPAAEARWGADMGILREEVRRVPLDEIIASYPYSEMMKRRSAEAMAGVNLALMAGDYDRARAIAEAEIDRLAAIDAARKGRADVGFELSLLISRLGTITGWTEGPSAGADRIADLLARYRIDAPYRPNVEMNHAALLAEAGRAREALAIMRPKSQELGVDENDPEFYVIPGSMREVGWIMACALTREEGAEAAAPYVAAVEAASSQPVDPYVGWTRPSAEIRLRMDKCRGDRAAFVATVRAEPPGVLSASWLEFQEHSRPILGSVPLAGLARETEPGGVAENYRQLPESYWPALRAWQPPRPAE